MNKKLLKGKIMNIKRIIAVSYTQLTLPTNSRV